MKTFWTGLCKILFLGAAGVGAIDGVEVDLSQFTGKSLKTAKFEMTLAGGAKVKRFSFGAVAKFSGAGQFLKIVPRGDGCLSNIEKCTKGLTASFRVMIRSLKEGACLMSSGGHNARSFGWAIMYRFGALQVGVSPNSDNHLYPQPFLPNFGRDIGVFTYRSSPH